LGWRIHHPRHVWTVSYPMAKAIKKASPSDLIKSGIFRDYKSFKTGAPKRLSASKDAVKGTI
jgi:hypothetical protein